METPNYLKSVFKMADEIFLQNAGFDDNLIKNLNDIKTDYILMVDIYFNKYISTLALEEKKDLLNESGILKSEIEAAFEQYIGSKNQI